MARCETSGIVAEDLEFTLVDTQDGLVQVDLVRAKTGRRAFEGPFVRRPARAASSRRSWYATRLATAAS
jgi:hypothetical protein